MANCLYTHEGARAKQFILMYSLEWKYENNTLLTSRMHKHLATQVHILFSPCIYIGMKCIRIYLNFLCFDILNYMSWYIRSFFGLTFLNVLYFFKYSCTNIFHRHSLYTFYFYGMLRIYFQEICIIMEQLLGWYLGDKSKHWNKPNITNLLGDKWCKNQ